MAEVKLNMDQWAGYLMALGRNFMPTVERGILSGAMRCVPLMQQRTMSAPPASPGGTYGAVDTGMYRMSWRATSIPNGARVYNHRPYAPVIEGGRRPSPVSQTGIRNIQGWAKRKLHLTDAEAKAAAFAIAKTLERRPLKARKVMSDAVAEMTDLVTAEVEAELKRALGR